jgi:hypothetical protein
MFVPVDLPENSAVRAEFYKKLCDKDLAEVKALWSKLVFTGKATAPKSTALLRRSKKPLQPPRMPLVISTNLRWIPLSKSSPPSTDPA